MKILDIKNELLNKINDGNLTDSLDKLVRFELIERIIGYVAVGITLIVMLILWLKSRKN